MRKVLFAIGVASLAAACVPAGGAYYGSSGVVVGPTVSYGYGTYYGGYPRYGGYYGPRVYAGGPYYRRPYYARPYYARPYYARPYYRPYGRYYY